MQHLRNYPQLPFEKSRLIAAPLESFHPRNVAGKQEKQEKLFVERAQGRGFVIGFALV